MKLPVIFGLANRTKADGVSVMVPVPLGSPSALTVRVTVPLLARACTTTPDWTDVAVSTSDSFPA